MSAMMKSERVLASQEEAIDSYLAGLLMEEEDATIAFPAPVNNTIPFVRQESISIESADDAPLLSPEPALEPIRPAQTIKPTSDFIREGRATEAGAFADVPNSVSSAMPEDTEELLALETPPFESPEPAITNPENTSYIQEDESYFSCYIQHEDSAPSFSLSANDEPPISLADQADSDQPLIDPALFVESDAKEAEAPALVPVPPIPLAGGNEHARQGDAPAEGGDAWQFFRRGALTIAAPATEIFAVLTNPSLHPVRQAPAHLAGAVQHQGRWAPVLSLDGLLPAINTEPVVVLLGSDGLWGIQLGQMQSPPDISALAAVQWRSNVDDTPSDRAWLAGVNPAQRLVVLNTAALRRLLDAATL
ncbi:hypothetical protein [Halothiobacillus sp. DCM-1]|uniref:hypothetical protein n=1 Tax=Halothiobacillus sp. DCM-1 TaxID=3112558 RepID=UPI00324FBCBA